MQRLSYRGVVRAMVIVIAAVCVVVHARAHAQGQKEQPMQATYYVLMHTPGEKWVHGKSFHEQPGVMDHAKYMAGLMERGVLVLAGPFLDNSGGMMVMRAESREAAEKIGLDDPTVKSGLLRVVVRPWLVAMSTLDAK